MTDLSQRSAGLDAFSVREIARTAHVSTRQVRTAITRSGVRCVHGFVTRAEAVLLVRQLRQQPAGSDRPVITTTPQRRSLSLACSGSLHALLLVALIGANWLGLLKADETTVEIKDPARSHLVFLISHGPGGGGGGGGLKIPAPPTRVRVRSPVPKKRVATPVPPPAKKTVPPPPIVRPIPVQVVPPPPPVPIPVLTPEPPRPPAPAAIQAPIVPAAADPVDAPGLPAAPVSAISSAGPGSGGGAGTGTGTGLGEGHGPGIGDGSGGGTGGGPYQPGTDIMPPTLVREVRPDYTADARRRSIEGDIALEIVVKRDGTVGNVRVLQTLAGGLEQKAIDAVRQWRFAPATRRGAAVDVVVTVSVGFKLR